MSVYRTLVKDKMRRFKGECAHFSFSKCHIYTHDGASAKFITNSHETDNSACSAWKVGASSLHAVSQEGWTADIVKYDS